jgi:hypothetical protein
MSYIATMLDINDFDAVFKAQRPEYSAALQQEIDTCRHHLGGKLFYDRLLETLQIKVDKLYPPRSAKDLRQLHKRIIDAPTLLHNKQCLLFYLLKDLTPSTHTETELSSSFGSAVHLGTRYWTFLEGLWALDRLNFETAVGYLTHPSIIPTFPDEILNVLLEHVDGYEKAMAKNLPMAYYLSAKPPLADEQVRDEFVRYMTRRDVTETYFWIRARPDFERKHLFEIFLDHCLDSHHGPEGNKRQSMAQELIGLPFDDEEEVWMEEFLIDGTGRNLPGARDTVMVRRILTGRVKEAVNDGGVKGRKYDQVNWDMLKDGLKRGLGPRVNEDTRFVAS